MAPRRFRYEPIPESERDPLLDMIRRVGSEYTYGVLPDGSGLETPEEVYARMVEAFIEVAQKVAPSAANKNGGISHKLLMACTGMAVRPGDLSYGKASTWSYRMAFVGLLAHLRGVKDTISDLEKLCLMGAQLAHDPRIAGVKRLEGKNLGVRDKFKRRKRIREGKQPKHSVYLPIRLVGLNPKAGRGRGERE